MSVYNIKSTVITNRDATPPALTEPSLGNGRVKGAVGVQRTSNAGSDLPEAGTAIRLITMPANARLQSLEHAAGALGTSAIDITVWYTTTIPQGGQNTPATSLAGTVIASSFFASNIAGIDTKRAWTDAMGLDATPTLDKRDYPLWKMLGLSNDPGLNLDLGFTIRTANAINGYVGLRATFVD